MTADPQRTVTLVSGNEMPSLGLGTWQLTGEAAEEGVEHALALGYRLIDTSGDYGNQPQIGAALERAAIERGDVYLVSKVEEDEDAYVSARQKVDELGSEYLDLCLIHRPPPDGPGEELWEGLLRARADGVARDVGVSNYTPDQIDALLQATGEAPAVNQLEWSPFGHSDEVMDHARAAGVVIQAYSPLTRGQRLDDPTVAEIAAAHEKTPAQVLLRWSVQSGAAPVPKAASAAHREQNVKVFDFELSPDEMSRLSALNEHYSALAGLPYV
jgi:2,5-diketo-D-gluconate reductase A